MAARRPLDREVQVRIRLPSSRSVRSQVRTCVRATRTPKHEARAAVAASFSYAETLRRLGLCPTGGNCGAAARNGSTRWGIDTDALRRAQRRAQPRLAPRRPLAEILVEGSTYARSNLKARLYAEGLKAPVCELCGQGELWRGEPMGLILDHVNGVRDDNRHREPPDRLPELRGDARHALRSQEPARADRARVPALRRDVSARRSARQRYCSRACGTRAPEPTRGVPEPGRCAASSGRRTTSCCARSPRRATSAVGAQVRRVGQRDPQVGAPVRARGGGCEPTAHPPTRWLARPCATGTPAPGDVAARRGQPPAPRCAAGRGGATSGARRRR